jgi:Flp pilus assembly protein TadD
MTAGFTLELKPMNLVKNTAIATSLLLLLFLQAEGQVDDFCAEFGAVPSLNSPFAQIPYLYGKIALRGTSESAKFPRVTITLVEAQQSERRLTIERKGNYCFRRSGNSTGTLIVEIDGVEAARRTVPSFSAAQQREDFEIYPNAPSDRPAAPQVVKFHYPPNEKTVDLYAKAAAAEAEKDRRKAIALLKEVVAVDPKDFVAWAKLGTVYFEEKQLAEAEASYRKALEQRVDYTPAWINIGKVRIANKQPETAVAIFRHVTTELEPDNARAHQLLGEAYLLTKQGTLGAESLNRAIELDPKGMAEVHLQLAHLYQLAKANKMAADEYRKFLDKVPDHPDRKKFEKFIKENP